MKQYRVPSAALLLLSLLTAPVFAEDLPFSRGVNLTRWFESSSPRTIQFTRYTIEDFRNIKSLGADVIRLPINLHAMTSGKPDYVLDPLFLEFLDQAVDMAEKTGIHIILDNHSFDPVAPTDPDIERVLLKVWPQMAAHFKDRSDYVLYEVLNEPHGIDVAKWGRVQGKVVEAIRKIDSRHAIVVGAANYNNIHDLKRLPKYPDANLIYTFHFYDPMLFTHQGAAWTSPSLADLAGVPYPPDSGPIPPLPQSLKGTWWTERLANYAKEGSFEQMKRTLDLAIQFRDERGVRLFCGEFGVYKPNSADADRIRWYRDVREYLEKTHIAWTSWDYRGGFGPFVPIEGGRFDYDLNLPLVAALGFTAPPQKIWTKAPETSPLDIYVDYPSPFILTEGWQKSGLLDFYSTAAPASGKYSILWKDAAQYDSFLFQFDTIKDLSLLVKEGYALQFMARSNNAKIKFDIRFMNSDAAPTDIPWRMVRTIDATLVPADRKWHLVRIPLSEMMDSGAWKGSENKWYEPKGQFSWADVVSLQIAAERGSLAGSELGFDDIRLAK